VASLVL